VASRTDFFSEDNLFVILGVLSDVPHIEFDPNDSVDRTRVFEVMHDRFTDTLPLPDLNKQVIKTVLANAAKPPQQQPDAASDQQLTRNLDVHDAASDQQLTRNLDVHDAASDQQLTRNLDVHGGRHMSLSLPDRPTPPNHEEAGAGHVDLSSAFEAMQASRAPAQDDRPQEIDFTRQATAVAGEALTAEAVLSRFSALQKEHESGMSAAKPPPTSAQTAPDEVEAGCIEIADPQAQFDSMFNAREKDIEAAVQTRADIEQTKVQSFKGAQVFRDDMASEIAGEASTPAAASESSMRPLSDAVRRDDEVKQMGADQIVLNYYEDANPEGLAEHALSNATEGRVADTNLRLFERQQQTDQAVSGSMQRVQSDLEVWKPDTASRQADFHRALQQQPTHALLTPRVDDMPAVNHNAGVLLHTEGGTAASQPTRRYKESATYLELSSGDRNRRVSGSETPSNFSVYFASQKTAIQCYPIFMNHPLELSSDVRKCAGLRGPPDPAVLTDCNNDLGDILHFEEIEVASNGVDGGANVDCVLKNVLKMVLKHVQLHARIGALAKRHPFVMLQIKGFESVFNSTTSSLRNAFCKLFFDCNSGVHDRFIPLSCEEKSFDVPLASIDRLVFSICTPEGKPLIDRQKTPDVLLVKTVRIVQLDDDGNEVGVTNATDKYYAAVDLHRYVRAICFEKGDLVSLKGLEWYNREAFCEWASSLETSACLDEQYFQEAECKSALDRATSDAERIKLRDIYSANQVRFNYPTCYGSAMSTLCDWLTSCHHIVHSTKTNPTDDSFFITIYVPYAYADDYATGTAHLNTLGLTAAGFQSFINGDPAAPSPDSFEAVGLNQTGLLNGVLCNESMQAQLSMTIITRVESTEERYGLQPANV
jgi:hypothetical protein